MLPTVGFAKGSGNKDRQILAAPINNRVFFSGDAQSDLTAENNVWV